MLMQTVVTCERTSPGENFRSMCSLGMMRHLGNLRQNAFYFVR
ncbi:hypothetical protein FHX40_2528 [Thermopolyspora flexuosa]|uniref:Uncharacterized protein n=1 Tax=Thermopolyspora flexuosa TaxID=103836 RepID=A0A543IZ07_9ACTN|nr:hypothetical protein FHX40_2528 [Thermopolyspora flexuosa]